MIFISLNSNASFNLNHVMLPCHVFCNYCFPPLLENDFISRLIKFQRLGKLRPFSIEQSHVHKQISPIITLIHVGQDFTRKLWRYLEQCLKDTTLSVWPDFFVQHKPDRNVGYLLFRIGSNPMSVPMSDCQERRF